MEAIAIVTILAVLQVFWFAFQVGQQRVKHGVKAPACAGDPEFERAFRVHQNTIEQLVLVVPFLFNTNSAWLSDQGTSSVATNTTE